MNPTPRIPEGFLRAREIGRRNRRILDLQMGWRWHAAHGDTDKCREIEEKIYHLKQHMEGEGQ